MHFDHSPDNLLQHKIESSQRPAFVLSNIGNRKLPARTAAFPDPTPTPSRKHQNNNNNNNNNGVNSSLSSHPAQSVTDELLGRTPRHGPRVGGGISGDWVVPLVPKCAEPKRQPLPPVAETKFAVCPPPETFAFFHTKKAVKQPPDPASLAFVPPVVLPQHPAETNKHSLEFFTSASGRNAMLRPTKQLLSCLSQAADGSRVVFCGNATPRANAGPMNQPAFSSVKVPNHSDLRARPYLDDSDALKIVDEHKKGLQLAKIHHPNKSARSPSNSNCNSGAATPRSVNYNIIINNGASSSLSQASVASSATKSARGRLAKNSAAALVVVASPPPENEYIDEEELVTSRVAEKEIKRFEKFILPPVIEAQKLRAAEVGKPQAHSIMMGMDEHMMQSLGTVTTGMSAGEFGPIIPESQTQLKSQHLSGPVSPDETATARVTRSAFEANLVSNLELVRRLKSVARSELESRLRSDFMHRRQISKEDFNTFVSRLLRHSNSSYQANNNNNNNINNNNYSSSVSKSSTDDQEHHQDRRDESKRQPKDTAPYSVSRRDVDLLWALLDASKTGICDTRELRVQLLEFIFNDVSPADWVAFNFIATLLEGKETQAVNAFISRFDLQTLCAAIIRRFKNEADIVKEVSALPDSFNFRSNAHLSRIPVAQLRDYIFASDTLLTVFQACALDARKAKNGGDEVSPQQQQQMSAAANKMMLSAFAASTNLNSSGVAGGARLGAFAPPAISKELTEQQQREQMILLARNAAAITNQFSLLHDPSSGNTHAMHEIPDGTASTQQHSLDNSGFLLASGSISNQMAMHRHLSGGVAAHDVMGVRGNYLKGGTAIADPILVTAELMKGTEDAAKNAQQKRATFVEDPTSSAPSGGGGGGTSMDQSVNIMDEESNVASILGGDNNNNSNGAANKSNNNNNNNNGGGGAGATKRRSPEHGDKANGAPAAPVSPIVARRKSIFPPKEQLLLQAKDDKSGNNTINNNSKNGKQQPQQQRDKRLSSSSVVNHHPIVSADKFVSAVKAKQESAEEHGAPEWFVLSNVLYRKSSQDIQPRPVFTQQQQKG